MTIMMIIMGNIQDENHDNQNLQAEDSTGRILIARVMHGGAADRSGLIAVGDEVGVMFMVVMLVMMTMVVVVVIGGQCDV